MDRGNTDVTAIAPLAMRQRWRLAGSSREAGSLWGSGRGVMLWKVRKRALRGASGIRYTGYQATAYLQGIGYRV